MQTNNFKKQEYLFLLACVDVASKRDMRYFKKFVARFETANEVFQFTRRMEIIKDKFKEENPNTPWLSVFDLHGRKEEDGKYIISGNILISAFNEDVKPWPKS